MVTQIINGRALAAEIKTEIAKEVFRLLKEGRAQPSLAIILVGAQPDSELYVRLKEREARRVGILTHTYRLPANVDANELKKVLQFLNEDPGTNGILVQLPLPSHLLATEIMGVLDPEKDVDGFLKNHPPQIVSPVVAAVILMLAQQNLNLDKLKLGILYNSEIFGQTLKKALQAIGVKQFVLVGRGEVEKLSDCEVVVSALGRPHFIQAKKLKSGAVVIDVGTTKKNGRVLGDLDPRGADKHLSAYSPVPGGVGPLTIAFLFKNVLTLYRRQEKL